MRESVWARAAGARTYLWRRREWIGAVLLASLLVAARCAVFIIYQQSFFDSDQAIVGLMAKHLIEGRAFPLFFYGQTYLLGVEAWIAAPFFLIGGPTVAALHTALMAVNLAIAALLIVCLVRWGGLRPFQAVAASLFFTLAPPFTGLLLIDANGANIEEFLYVLILWVLRDRPLWFGAILAIGVLNREFTMYAVPVLLAGQLLTGTLFRAARLRMWLVAAAAFLAVWQTVDVLKPFADVMGPGTRGTWVEPPGGSAMDNLVDRAEIVPREFPERMRVMATDYFPRQIGARAVESSTAPQGRDWMFWPLGLGLMAAGLRALFLTIRCRLADGRRPATDFGWYLFGIGVLAAAVYIATRSIDRGLIDRYMLLTIYAPVGVVALFLALEPRVWLRRGMVALLLAWASVSAVDHARLFARYWGGREPDELQRLADGLVARGIHVASAGYWRAYRVTFLARERVKVMSTDVSRIREYERLAEVEGNRLIQIRDTACASDQPPIGQWYLCRDDR